MKERDELTNTEALLNSIGIARLAGQISDGDYVENNLKIRQGKITAVTIGSTTTKITALVNGVSVANIMCLAGWRPYVNDGVWILDSGRGRWLAIGEHVNSGWNHNYDVLITQSGSIAHSITESSWKYDGDFVEWTFNFGITGTGAAANELRVALPVASLQSNFGIHGIGEVFSNTLGFSNICAMQGFGTYLTFRRDQSTAAWGIIPNIAINPSSAVNGHVRYRWI